MNDKSPDFDVIIIGGGPGGLSALFWCVGLGLTAILFERNAEFGGQLLVTHNIIKNYLGIEGATGRELRDIFVRQMANMKSRMHLGADVVESDLLRKTVVLADGVTFSSRAIVLATGVRRRKLDVPGEESFLGRGILESGAKEKDEVKGKRVLIVGGGDAAIENCAILSKVAEKVFVVHRQNKFSARLEFMENARRTKNVALITNTVVRAIVGDQKVKFVEVKDVLSGQLSRIATDAVLIRIGVQPNSEIFCGQVDLDMDGYVKIDNLNTTSLDMVYAVGDLAIPVAPTLSAAVGDGATIAKTIFSQLC